MSFLALAALVPALAAAAPAKPAAPAAPAFEGQLAGSGTHACLLKPTHDVVCWGLDLQNTRIPSPSGEPEKVPDLDDAQEIAVGYAHGCAVRSGGKVSCWGFNQLGQLAAPPDSTFHPKPQDVAGLDGVVHLAANGNRTCAVTAAGTLSCWGSLDPYAPKQHELTQIFGLTDVKQVVMGEIHVCALQGSGHVQCWGDNQRGEVGNGQRDSKPFGVVMPTPVAGLDDAVQLTAARMDTCALKKSGQVVCWGDRSGQFAPPANKGSSRFALLPTPLPGATGVKSVMLTETAGCLLKGKDNQLACWWSPFEPQAKPDFAKLHPAGTKLQDVKLPELAKGTRQLISAEETYALVAGGKVLRWAGRGARVAGEPVKGLKDAAMVSTGAHQSCAVRTNGTVACWGAIGSGTESSGVEAPPTAKFSSVPVAVAKLKDAVSVSVGSAHACALDKAGAVWCWGNNAAGQLGNGKKGAGLSGEVRARAHITDPIPPPELLPREGAAKVKLPAKAVQVAAGTDHSCAVLESGAVFCWGGNAHGQLGTGANAASVAPVAVAGLTDATRIAVSDAASCALKKDGTVVCWGQDALGLLGAGAPGQDVRAPQPVPGLVDATDVSASAGGSCATLKDGTARCWGKRSHFLGDEGTDFRGGGLASVKGVADAQALAVGSEHRCVRHASGSVSCWGRNLWGAVGDGTRVDRLAPVEVVGLSGVKSLSAGEDQSCAVKSDAQVTCWGSFLAGGLGTGVDPTMPHPLALAAPPAVAAPAPAAPAKATPTAAHP